MGFVVERSVEHVFVWFACFSFLGLFGKCIDKVTINFWTSDHARCRRAILSGVEVARHCDCLDCKFNIGIVENNYWRLATEFKLHALQTFCCSLGDFHAGANRTGDRCHAGCRVHDHAATSVAVTANYVQYTRRQNFARNFCNQRSRCWCRVAWLQNCRVASSNRRNELPNTHHQRVVPRGDLRANADRFASYI